MGQMAIHTMDGSSMRLMSQFPGYVNGYLGGFNVATGDTTGDGISEILLGGIHTGSSNDPFSGQYRVLDGTTVPLGTSYQPIIPLREVQAFQRQFTRGVSVAPHDIDLDGLSIAFLLHATIPEIQDGFFTMTVMEPASTASSSMTTRLIGELRLVNRRTNCAHTRTAMLPNES